MKLQELIEDLADSGVARCLSMILATLLAVWKFSELPKQMPVQPTDLTQPVTHEFLNALIGTDFFSFILVGAYFGYIWFINYLLQTIFKFFYLAYKAFFPNAGL